MRPRLRDLPRAVALLALALARGDHCEVLSATRLIPGVAIQLALHWCLREVLVRPGRSVVLYSKLDHDRTVKCSLRKVLGIGFAVVVGLVLFALNHLFLLLCLALLILTGGGGNDQVLLGMAMLSIVRLFWTAMRAVKAYRVEHQRGQAMVRLGDAPRWRLELIGATPPGNGYGLSAVRTLTHTSDAAGATVYLVCAPSNYGFYRRAGFRTVPTPGPAFKQMLLMRRIAPVQRDLDNVHRPRPT